MLSKDGKKIFQGSSVVFKKSISICDVYNDDNLDAPEGFKFTGEFRPPVEGEYYLQAGIAARSVCVQIKEPRVILVIDRRERIVFTYVEFRPVKSGDWIKDGEMFHKMQSGTSQSYYIYERTEEEV